MLKAPFRLPSNFLRERRGQPAQRDCLPVGSACPNSVGGHGAVEMLQ
jgi:hypothetical protein